MGIFAFPLLCLQQASGWLFPDRKEIRILICRKNELKTSREAEQLNQNELMSSLQKCLRVGPKEPRQ